MRFLKILKRGASSAAFYEAVRYIDLATGRKERWTGAFFDPELNPQSFVTLELVQINSFDGLLISRWLYLPDARKFPSKHPMIMDFHGGPESQSRVQFMGHRTTI